MTTDTQTILNLVTGFFGFVLAVGLTVGVILWVRKPVRLALGYLIHDPALAEMGSLFVLILLGLQGLATALNYITQQQLGLLLHGLTGLLNGLADVLQWMIYVAALLFIGYALRGRKGSAD